MAILVKFTHDGNTSESRHRHVAVAKADRA